MKKKILVAAIVYFILSAGSVSAVDVLEGHADYIEPGQGSAGYYYIGFILTDNREVCLMGTYSRTWIRDGGKETLLNDHYWNLIEKGERIKVKLTQNYSDSEFSKQHECGRFGIHGIRILH